DCGGDNGVATLLQGCDDRGGGGERDLVLPRPPAENHAHAERGHAPHSSRRGPMLLTPWSSRGHFLNESARHEAVIFLRKSEELHAVTGLDSFPWPPAELGAVPVHRLARTGRDDELLRRHRDDLALDLPQILTSRRPSLRGCLRRRGRRGRRGGRRG